MSFTLPLDDEPFVPVWVGYAREATDSGVFNTLQSHIARLRFPIRAGMSLEDDYRAATLRGKTTQGMVHATGLKLRAPNQVRLFLHPTAAGHIPVIVAAQREDFVSLIQALSGKNEPIPIPDSMGASMIAGFNNWERVAAHRESWAMRRATSAKASGESFDANAEWPQEFARLVPQYALYQDRFIVLQEGYYSAVTPAELQLDDATWRALSLTIRLEHECAHYLTLRVLGSMNNSLHDELVADYAGIVAATGKFRADWFLRFMGLENYPAYREGGRLQNYRGTPPIADAEFVTLQRQAFYAAQAIERFDNAIAAESVDIQSRARVLLVIASQSLKVLASPAVHKALLLAHASNGTQQPST